MYVYMVCVCVCCVLQEGESIRVMGASVRVCMVWLVWWVGGVWEAQETV